MATGKHILHVCFSWVRLRPIRAKQIGFVLFALALCFHSTTSSLAEDKEAALWDALRHGEAFAMMRHAIAPGFGDPDNFTLDDCSTQRNLSKEGLRQAASIGNRFRQNGIKIARVVSSEWCRCQDTALELGLGPVETLDALNSFFDDRDLAKPQTDALTNWLALNGSEVGRPLVLVTHQVNVSALVGRSTRSGEVVVIRRDETGTLIASGSL